MKILKDIPVEKMLDLFQEFSWKILKSESLKPLEGVAFVSQWMQKSNIKKILQENLGNMEVLEKFVQVKSGEVITEVKVETGSVASNGNMEITGGLKDGDVVILK